MMTQIHLHNSGGDYRRSEFCDNKVIRIVIHCKIDQKLNYLINLFIYHQNEKRKMGIQSQTIMEQAILKYFLYFIQEEPHLWQSLLSQKIDLTLILDGMYKILCRKYYAKCLRN